MRKTILIVLGLHLVAVLLGTSCKKKSTGVETDAYVSYNWPVSNPDDQGFDANLLADALEEAGERTFLVSLLVVRHGYLVVEEYFTGWDPDDAYSIRSITKSLISASVGIALHQGFIDSLDQRLLDFFPEYNTPSLDPRKRQITIRHLLTMRAGFDRDENVDPQFTNSANWIRDTIQLPLINDPGETFTYSTMAVHLLSGVITKAAGMSTLDFMEANLCEPLGISIRLWDRDPQGYYFGGGSMYMTSRDMARFGYLYIENGLVDGQPIIPEEWIDSSFQNSTGEYRQWGVLEELGYGYLWWLGKIQNHPVQFASGYAGQYIVLIPDVDVVIVTTAIFPFNDEMADAQSESIFELIADHILPSIRDTS